MSPPAHEAIRALLGTYCELMDAGDWHGLGEMFADAELLAANGAVVAAGAAAVEDLYQRGTRLYDGSPRTRHITSNSVLDVSGPQAQARSAYVVFQGVAGFPGVEDFPLQPIVTGRYHDRFACDGSTWRFARRQFFIDQVGDVSRHLTYRIN